MQLSGVNSSDWTLYENMRSILRIQRSNVLIIRPHVAALNLPAASSLPCHRRIHPSQGQSTVGLQERQRNRRRSVASMLSHHRSGGGKVMGEQEKEGWPSPPSAIARWEREREDGIAREREVERGCQWLGAGHCTIRGPLAIIHYHRLALNRPPGERFLHAGAVMVHL